MLIKLNYKNQFSIETIKIVLIIFKFLKQEVMDRFKKGFPTL